MPGEIIRHLVVKQLREPVLWQTLSPSALAAPAGSLSTAYVLSLRGVFVIGMEAQAAVLTLRWAGLPVTQELTKGIVPFWMSHLALGLHQRCTHLSSLPIAGPCLIPDHFHS